MRLLIQRVKKSHVKVEKKIIGKINQGLLIFFAAKKGDKLSQVKFLAKKTAFLRVFSDKEGKMNLSIKDVKGEILIVSQFTLYGDCQKGRRPSFIQSAEPQEAKKLYKQYIKELQKEKIKVTSGIFQAKMEVELINDGPVTFIIEK